MSAPQPAARIVLGVGGSIAAYKACDLASKLVQAGHRLDVVMTRAAEQFVRPLSFSALTHRAVYCDATWFEDAPGRSPADHLLTTQEADLLVVAPCTANLLGKFAHGIADDVLTTTWLGAACPVLVAPAMNARMWDHPRVRANVGTLRDDGVRFVGPDTGYLAEAEEGPGRMAEPAAILAAIEEALAG
jgi:phosphopantothenoylcysteine synthetase/decarboxylase